MLALMIAGALDKAPTFKDDDISADLIKSSFNPHDQNLCDYVQLIAPLREMGRDDLAQAIEGAIDKHLDREPGLKAWTKRLDRKYLDGNLTGFWGTIHKHIPKR
jgi:hypothetical protein